MSEESGTEPPLRPCTVEYLESLGSNPEELRRRYPNTYEALSNLTCPEVEVLNTMGAALAQDDPKGDHHKDADADEAPGGADAAGGAAEKLNKYLYALH